ncbi:MAG: CapA family protein [Desulfitobacteriaceae bacterium]|nr:CapA family protein [Desulfitobacteriaceae bacterium]
MADKITILAVGDLAPLRNVTDCNPGVNQIWQRFKEANITTANLEIALTYSSVGADKAITLKADPDIAYSLAEAGIDVVSVANNHACDFGAQGLFDTIEALKKAKVAAVGGGKNLDMALEPVIQKVNGQKIAHFGLCSALPTGFGASISRPGVAPIRARSRFYIDSITLDEQPGMSPWVETSVVEDDLAYVCEKIATVKEQVDFIIVNIHWGIPHGWCALFQGPLADYQKPVAYGLIDAGADLIIGHHPHVIHGVERYKNGIIAYSLGNFLFHSMSDDHVTKLTTKYPPYNVESLEQGEAREAVIMETDIKEHQIKEVRFYPVAFNRRGEPEYLPKEAALNVLDRLQKHSRKLGSEIFIKDAVGILKMT